MKESAGRNSQLNFSKLKMMIILGEGGHTKQLLKLINLLGNNYQYQYILTKEDYLSENQIKYKGPIYRLMRPRGKKTKLIKVFFRTFIVSIQSFIILVGVRPDAIISNGPAISVPVSIMGKLLGAKIIFVESASRIKSLSFSGRIMYRWSDLFFVQWPHLKRRFPTARYAGRLM
jgi:UDP-N-acetylglucosamine:LPS N-acetylglucosamine transferase